MCWVCRPGLSRARFGYPVLSLRCVHVSTSATRSFSRHRLEYRQVGALAGQDRQSLPGLKCVDPAARNTSQMTSTQRQVAKRIGGMGLSLHLYLLSSACVYLSLCFLSVSVRRHRKKKRTPASESSQLLLSRLPRALSWSSYESIPVELYAASVLDKLTRVSKETGQVTFLSQFLFCVRSSKDGRRPSTSVVGARLCASACVLQEQHESNSQTENKTPSGLSYTGKERHCTTCHFPQRGARVTTATCECSENSPLMHVSVFLCTLRNCETSDVAPERQQPA